MRWEYAANAMGMRCECAMNALECAMNALECAMNAMRMRWERAADAL
jgi:hypothetical protein